METKINFIYMTMAGIKIYNDSKTSVYQALDMMEDDPYVSAQKLSHFTLYLCVVVMTTICIFGVFSNIINIVVFVKMGFKDPVNIPLVSMAVADTGSVLFLIWMGLCYNPLMVNRFPQMDLQGIQHLTAGWPHFLFSRITSWLTALVTFERYLCVAFPLTIKTLVTRRRTTVTVVTIFVLLMASMIPLYLGTGLGYDVHSHTNFSVVTLLYFTDGRELENVTLMIATFAQISAFATVVIFTVGLVQKISEKSKWRNSVTSASVNETSSTRDKKVVKMIVWISLIFIVTYTPVVTGLIVMLLVQDFSIAGRFPNFFLVTWQFFFCLEAMNSSVNIFVYLKMSSKYKVTLLALCGIRPTNGKRTQ